MHSNKSLTRRTLLCSLLGTGMTTFFAACGTTTPTPTNSPATTAPPSTAPSNPVAATPSAAGVATQAATPTRATPSTSTGATATRGGATATSAGATPITATGSSPLLQALAVMPRHDQLPGQTGIAFADIERQKRNYGLEKATSAEAFESLPEATAILTNVTASVPLPNQSGLTYAMNPQWREATGFDFWQVERTIQAGSPPQLFTQMWGRFDQAEITAAMARAEHQPRSYGGATILAYGEDGQFNLNQPLSKLTFANFNRVVLAEGTLTFSGFSSLIEAGIDAQAGRIPNFGQDPDYAAIATALGPVVGAQIVPPDTIFHPAPGPQRTPVGFPTAAPSNPRLPAYRLAGFGLRDDGITHTMVVVLLFHDLATANAAAPIVQQRASSYRLRSSNEPLRNRAIVGTPEVAAQPSGATVMLPFAITDTANLGLWLRMFNNADYGFLAE